MTGHLYGVGVGPGDPELITLKAAKLIRRAEVIAYHSGEDRIVKHAFREWSAACTCPPRQPICTCGGRSMGEGVTRKAIMAGEGEIAVNPRARSARLRAWRRGE